MKEGFKMGRYMSLRNGTEINFLKELELQDV
jgi:hypothetical protein